MCMYSRSRPQKSYAKLQQKLSGGLIQIPCQSRRHVQQNMNGSVIHTYKSLFVTNDYTLSDYVGHPTFQLGSMNSDKKIESNHQMLDNV